MAIVVEGNELKECLKCNGRGCKNCIDGYIPKEEYEPDEYDDDT